MSERPIPKDFSTRDIPPDLRILTTRFPGPADRPSPLGFEIGSEKERAGKAAFLEKVRSYQRVAPEDAELGLRVEPFLLAQLSASELVGSRIFVTTTFDDVFNGVDAVLSWSDDGESLVNLAVDLKTGTNRQSVATDFASTVEEAGRVKYWHAPDGSADRTLDLPRVLVGVDIALLSFAARDLRYLEVLPPDHWLGALMVEQMKCQIDFQIGSVLRRVFSSKISPTKPRHAELFALASRYAAEPRDDRHLSELLSSVPRKDLVRILGELQTRRAEQLPAVKRTLDDRYVRARDILSRPDVAKIVRQSSLHEQILDLSRLSAA